MIEPMLLEQMGRLKNASLPKYKSPTNVIHIIQKRFLFVYKLFEEQSNSRASAAMEVERVNVILIKEE